MTEYSNSRLRKFEECPRAYKFKYIEKVEVERVQNVYGFMGSRVHEVLEILHDELMKDCRSTLDKLLQIFEEEWRKKWTDDILISSKSYSEENFIDAGKKCIRNYYENHEPFEKGQTIDTELYLKSNVQINEKEYRFKGYLDRLTLLPDGTHEIHDYKTSKNLLTQAEADQDRQLGIYTLMVMQEYPNAKNVELIWHYLRFGKDIRSRRSNEDLDKLKRGLAETIEKIERAVKKDNFPTKRYDGARCDWCDYKHLCPEWNEYHEIDNFF